MFGAHGRLIASAARKELQPLGFMRKGRSRTWLADRGWWVVVAEFQPSSWGKGSYLNVGAHWLWSSHGFISFDFGGRLPGFADYISNQQFGAAAKMLAVNGAQEAQNLIATFDSIAATAKILKVHAEALGAGGPSWPMYNAAVAAGLTGRMDDAIAMFNSITDARVRELADEMARAALEPVMFKRAVDGLVAKQRLALGLALRGPFGPV